MNKKKTAKKAAQKSPAKKKPLKPAPASILEDHADQIRQVVHKTLADAGIHGLSLQSIQFAAIPVCPDGQHAEKVCSRGPGGAESCTWRCVPN